jgi:isopenicillin N synthase-like dioxygenase
MFSESLATFLLPVQEKEKISYELGDRQRGYIALEKEGLCPGVIMKPLNFCDSEGMSPRYEEILAGENPLTRIDEICG